jgi:hypothetical protein
MDETGARPDDVARLDDAAIINEAGLPGFAVDGTDSFAVPGPADGLEPEDADPDAGAPYRRLIVTVGAAVIALVIVFIIGSSGRDDRSVASLRTADTTTAFTLRSPFGTDGTVTETTPGGDEATATTEGGDVDAQFSTVPPATDPYQYQYDDQAFPSVATTSDPYGDFSYHPVTLPDYSPYLPYTPTPRRIVPVSPVTPSRPRVTAPRVTTPPATTTTAATTTTTAAATTTTTEAATTTTAAATAATAATTTAPCQRTTTATVTIVPGSTTTTTTTAATTTTTTTTPAATTTTDPTATTAPPTPTTTPCAP